MEMKTRCSSLMALLALLIGWPATAQRSLCAPVSNNPLVMEVLCSDASRVVTTPPVLRPKPAAGPLALTVEEINRARLHGAPPIRMGDTLVFEANRSDFIFELQLSNWHKLMVRPPAAN